MSKKVAVPFAFLLALRVSTEPLDVVGHRAAIRLAVFLRIDQCAEFDQVGDRVEVDGMGFAAQSKCLQRNRPAAGERVEHLGSIPFGPGMQYLVGGGDQFASRFDVLRVVRVLPLDQMLDEFQAAVPWRVLDCGAVPVLRPELASVEQSITSLRKLSGIRDRRGRESARQTPPPGTPPMVAEPTRCEGSRYARGGSTSPEPTARRLPSVAGRLDETFQHFAVLLSSLAVTTSGASVMANW